MSGSSYLGRAPAGASDIAFWVNDLAHGATDEQLAAAFVASPEFLQREGGTMTGWLTGAYNTILGRAPDPTGFNYWLSVLQAG